MSNEDTVLLLLTVTEKFAGYFLSLNLNSIISFSFDSHSESEKELSMLSEPSKSRCSLLISGSVRVLLDVCAELVTELTAFLLLYFCVCVCLSEICYSDLYWCTSCCH